MPLQATSGAASYDAFGGGLPAVPNYIEDVFSTYLYTGTGSSRSITNGIDLAGKGGLVWTACRSNAYGQIRQTSVGTYLDQTTAAAAADGSGNFITAFNSTGFTIGDGTAINNSGSTFASWTFRKQPKFFDVVTYTGNGAASSRTVNHSLNCEVGMVFVKKTSGTGYWAGWHRSISGFPQSVLLNSTAAAGVNATYVNGYIDAVTSTSFTLEAGTDVSAVNANGETYVAYLFAHNAGGFGLTGTENVISCGSFTSDGATDTSVTLGYEPQWVMMKKSSGTGNWFLLDTMRRWNLSGNDAMLIANLSDDESSFSGQYGNPTATGFLVSPDNIGSGTFIYIAIRKGPMKVPTSGTSVFYPTTYTGTGSARTFSGFGFPPDMELSFSRGGIAAGDGNGPEIYDKLRGTRVRLLTPVTDAEYTTTESVTMLQDGISVGATTHSYINASGYTKGLYGFKRAPSFFDEVCYTGNATTRTINHNLGVVPEFMIIKGRTGSPTYNWICYHNSFASNQVVELNTTTGVQNNGGAYNIATLSSTVFGLKTGSDTNGNGNLQVAYLFATCAGVSKVGSYTGNGSTQTIDCGFTGGARFVLIKKTSGTGDWMVSDSARGIVSGSDPYLELNNTNAEVTGEDWLDTDSTGFVVNEVSGSNANTSSATYIFLAIA